jgi:hypothetical protein
VFRQLLKPAAGQFPHQRDGQIFSGTMISASGTPKTSAGRRKTQQGEWRRVFYRNTTENLDWYFNFFI